MTTIELIKELSSRLDELGMLKSSLEDVKDQVKEANETIYSLTSELEDAIDTIDTMLDVLNTE